MLSLMQFFCFRFCYTLSHVCKGEDASVLIRIAFAFTSHSFALLAGIAFRHMISLPSIISWCYHTAARGVMQAFF